MFPRQFRSLPSISVSLLLAAFIVTGSIAAKQNATTDSGVRVCKASSQSASTAKKTGKQKKNKSSQSPSDAGNACIEVRTSALDVQEHLQAFIREQRWLISDEEVNETLWSFRLYLAKDELLNFAKPDFTSERVDWQRGKALVLVTTVDLGDGYARTIVSAQFEGYGESDDALVTQRSVWALSSNGKLETKIADALQTHFQRPR